jgi:hypothetical protein
MYCSDIRTSDTHKIDNEIKTKIKFLYFGKSVGVVIEVGGKIVTAVGLIHGPRQN